VKELMSTKIVKLGFSAPVHLGNGRLSDTDSVFAADTLFSALFIEAIKLGCESDLLQSAREGDLTISDAFPYIGDTFFLPKPMVSGKEAKAAQTERADSIQKKALKNLPYISTSSYGDFLTGRLDPVAEEEKLSGLGYEDVQTKVNLMRIDSEDAKPYHVGTFTFADDAGLYFLVKGTYDLIPVLDALQYSGLGGKRTSGYGRFTFEVIENSEVTKLVSAAATQEKTAVLLASSFPKETELNEELITSASYRLKRRSGFVQSETYSATPNKKRDFYSFAAGSVFSGTFEGDVFDVGAGGSHPVYRYAKAMWMEVAL
jgi:CRISPR-associated protein Csm4